MGTINIETSTLFALIVILNIFTVLFFFIYIHLYNNLRIQKLKLFAFARLLQSITWVVYLLKIRELDWITMAISMIPLGFGVFLEAYCLVTVNEKLEKKKLLKQLYIPLIYSIIYFTVAYFTIARVVIASSYLAFVYAFIWFKLALKKNNSGMERVTGWIGFATALTFLIRGLITLLAKVHLMVTSQLYFNVLAGIGIFISTAFWPLLFLFLQKENDERLILSKDKKIERDNLKLKRINATKDKFFSIISHDLRSPFSSIFGFLELIIENSKNRNFEEIEEYSKLAYHSAQQSFNLMNNLLEWSRIQPGRLKLSREKFKLSELVKNIEALLEGRLNAKQIDLKISMNEKIILYADKFMIDSTIRNLLSNAIKFSKTGGKIELSIRQTVVDTKIVIKDHGVGIAPETLAKLFDEEFNVTTEGTDREKGSGLGLILCKEFIEKHNGTLRIQSNLGSGTTATCVIPSSE